MAKDYSGVIFGVWMMTLFVVFPTASHVMNDYSGSYTKQQLREWTKKPELTKNDHISAFKEKISDRLRVSVNFFKEDFIEVSRPTTLSLEEAEAILKEKFVGCKVSYKKTTDVFKVDWSDDPQMK